jgi:hypothetical protein
MLLAFLHDCVKTGEGVEGSFVLLSTASRRIWDGGIVCIFLLRCAVCRSDRLGWWDTRYV